MLRLIPRQTMAIPPPSWFSSLSQEVALAPHKCQPGGHSPKAALEGMSSSAAWGGGFLQPMEQPPFLPFIGSMAGNKGPVKKGNLAGETSQHWPRPRPDGSASSLITSCPPPPQHWDHTGSVFQPKHWLGMGIGMGMEMGMEMGRIRVSRVIHTASNPNSRPDTSHNPSSNSHGTCTSSLHKAPASAAGGKIWSCCHNRGRR